MTLNLGQRAVALPVKVSHVAVRRQAFMAALLVSSGDMSGAHQIATALATRAAKEPLLREPALRAAALSRLFVDLGTAGWQLSVEDGQVFALPPQLEEVRSDEDLMRAKSVIRGTMLARVREQVRGEGRLVQEVEPQISRLIADGPALAATLTRRGASGVQPYLQLARRADGDDTHTGLSLHSIYRYLRYWWAFPYNDIPGRSLPFLIRDRGQPDHPVCGLLCLSSPLLRLTDRDDALGLTPAWLESVTAGLVAIASHEPLPRLAQLRAELTQLKRAALTAARVERDLGELLRVEAPLLRWVARTPHAQRAELAREAATRVVGELVDELRASIESVSLDGLGITLSDALASPEIAAERLRALGKEAHDAWAEGREGEVSRGSAEDKRRLFYKKRARQLSELLIGWSALMPLRAALADGTALDALRTAALRDELTGGSGVPRGLSDALLARKVRLASTQIADISLCGAIPPYDGLLGGKLAAMVALSRDAAAAYHSAYDGKVSLIQSQMAGEDVVRPAELIALTTTSFYGVGSSQYNRVSLPTGLRWEEVGETRGHGTLHLSADLCDLLLELIRLVEGRQLITSQFGEGPSERLRKLRDGLTLLDLPASHLLQHGLSRLVYVAPLGPRTMPGARPAPAHHYLDGPTMEHVSDVWRSRWLAPRLGRAIEHARTFDSSTLLLSSRFTSELASGRESPSPLAYESAPEEDIAWGVT